MDIFRLVLGLIVLTAGRKLFWLVVGVIGFIVGITLAPQLFGNLPPWVILVIALIAGLVGALLAVFLQTVGIGLAGFVGGGYIAVSLLTILGWQANGLAWLPFVIGGIIGLVLILALFDLALIVLSSLIGASMVVQAINLGRPVSAVLFVVLVILGFVIQARLLAPPGSED
jgi:hypothetical protein